MADVSQIVSALLPIIQNVVAGAMKSGGSGFFGKLKEAQAIVGFLGESAQNFKGNSIIEGVVQALTQGGDDNDTSSPIDLKSLDVSSVLDKVGGLDDLLKDAGEEGGQVKNFVFDLAERVTSASGSGLFGTGQKVSEGEAEFLNNLKGKLGL